MSGHLANPFAQKALQALDEEAGMIADADVDWLLSHEQGRRLAVRLTYLLLRLDSPSLETNASDGAAMALLTARNEGLREAGGIFAAQLKRVSRQMWLLALDEAWAAEEQLGDRRREAENLPHNGET